MTAVLAAESGWPVAVVICTAFVCMAAVLIALLLAPTPPRETTRTTRSPEWRSETTVTRPNPSDPRPKGERK